MDFLEPSLSTYLSEEIRKTELTFLAPTPVLFHSGYLTIDTVTETEKINPLTGKLYKTEVYSFKLPNLEVSSSYETECFKVILNLGSSGDLETLGAKLRKAFLSKDAKTVSDEFKNFFSSLAYHLRQENEKIFHSFVHLILKAMGFKVLSEVPVAEGRMDLCVFLPNKVYLIIELKYCQMIKKLTKKEENKALAATAITQLSNDLINSALSLAILRKLDVLEINKLFSQLPKKPTSKKERDIILAREAENFLTVDERNKALARLAEDKIPQNQLQSFLDEASFEPDLSDTEIDTVLTNAAQSALEQISIKDYGSIANLNSETIIPLGLAVYGTGSKVKAIFGS
jgi:hypothetical protein